MMHQMHLVWLRHQQRNDLCQQLRRFSRCDCPSEAKPPFLLKFSISLPVLCHLNECLFPFPPYLQHWTQSDFQQAVTSVALREPIRIESLPSAQCTTSHIVAHSTFCQYAWPGSASCRWILRGTAS